MRSAFALIFTVVSSVTIISPALADGTVNQNLDGPAASLECVALLEHGDTGLIEAFAKKSKAAQKTCIDQLLQSLTPEPEFTAEEVERALTQDLYGRADERGRRMMARIEINRAVSNGIAALADRGLIRDSYVIQPLIRCLEHPVLAVGRRCQYALMSLTRHTYGSEFWQDSLPTKPIMADRDRLVHDWTAWNQMLTPGHPIFDEDLNSESLSAIRAVGVRLVGVLNRFDERAAASYIRYRLVENLLPETPKWNETIFTFAVDPLMVSYWPPSEGRTYVGVWLFRPGIKVPEAGQHGVVFSRGTIIAKPTCREAFPALDLEFRLEIRGSTELQRAACAAARDGLEELRTANATAAVNRM
jgi:hypothetical protein